jgi:formate dehydrogenase major subunit
MYHLKIDGEEIDVPEGTTVLKAAKMAGIEIPTLCDHPALEPYGGCRLCLVDIEGARTLQPACTLPAGNNMVVHTQTEKVKSARTFVLSMLFSERNHFCPYCQVSGGDCELQNAAYAQEMTHWPLQPNWHPFEVDASHPYFVLDHNRCILCRRCVRACGELVGNYTLGMEERGSKTVLVADLGIPLGSSSCISCGTCVQICPTGALIDRWSAYRGHEADISSTETICVGCSIGCGIDVLTRNNALVRIEGNWEAEINGGVICEIGRFHPLAEKRQRVVTPMIRKNGALKAATWDEAISVVSDKLKDLNGHKNDGVAAIASTRLPAESLNLFAQIFKDQLGNDLVTSTEEGAYTSYIKALASENMKESGFEAINQADLIFTIGVDLVKDHQVAGFFVKRAIGKEVDVITVSNELTGIESFTPYGTIIGKGSELEFVNALTLAYHKKRGSDNFSKVGISEKQLAKLAKLFAEAANPLIIFGTNFESKNKMDVVRAILKFASETNSKYINLKGNANSVAASRLNLESSFALNGHKAVYLALGDEDPSQTLTQKVENSTFIIVQASYHSALTAKADVVLPVTNWLEQTGHYVAADGKIQEAKAALIPASDVKSNEDVFRTLAAQLGLSLDEDWEKAIKTKFSVVEVQSA